MNSNLRFSQVCIDLVKMVTNLMRILAYNS